MALSIQCALRQQRQQHQQRQQTSRMQHLMALRVLVKPHPRNPGQLLYTYKNKTRSVVIYLQEQTQVSCYLKLYTIDLFEIVHY